VIYLYENDSKKFSSAINMFRTYLLQSLYHYFVLAFALQAKCRVKENLFKFCSYIMIWPYERNVCEEFDYF